MGVCVCKHMFAYGCVSLFFSVMTGALSRMSLPFPYRLLEISPMALMSKQEKITVWFNSTDFFIMNDLAKDI